MNGVSFDGVHSGNDLELVLSAWEITMPAPRASQVSLPAGDGSEDAVEYADGTLPLENGTARFVFTYLGTDHHAQRRRAAALLHGKVKTIVLDADPDHAYRGRCTVAAAPGKSLGTIEVICDYEPYTTDTTYTTVPLNRVTGKTIVNDGGAPAPCIVEVTPAAAISELTLKGIARDRFSGADVPITVRNLTEDTQIVIDGEKKLITEAGENKAGDAEIWEFPSLAVGNNIIMVSSALCDISIRYKRRYLG